MNANDRRGRYVKHIHASPISDHHQQQHPISEKKHHHHHHHNHHHHHSGSYPLEHGSAERYTPNPKPLSAPAKKTPAPELESQDSNWTLKEELRQNAINGGGGGGGESKGGRHDNRSRSPDSGLAISDGSNLSGHGGGGGGVRGGGNLQASKGVFSRSMLDIREPFVDEASTPAGEATTVNRAGGGGGGEGVVKAKVKVDDFRDGVGTGELARNRFKSESNLFELEVEETSFRGNERRTAAAPVGASFVVPSNIPIRTLRLRRLAGMFGFILNCKPVLNDPYVPDMLRYYPHVESIVENSIAKASGLRCGDFVLEIGGHSVRRSPLELCDFLIRSSGDCLRLTVAAYGQIQSTVTSRTFENEALAKRSRQNPAPPRTPVGHKSSMERRCNDAKNRHVTGGRVHVQGATSTADFVEVPHQNIYEELNEAAVFDQDTPLGPSSLPYPDQPEVDRRSTGSGNNSAKPAGGNSDARWGRTQPNAAAPPRSSPPSPPPRPQGNDGGWERSGGETRRYSVETVLTDVTQAESFLNENKIYETKLDFGIAPAAKVKVIPGDSIPPPPSSFSSSSSSSSIAPKMPSFPSHLVVKREEDDRPDQSGNPSHNYVAKQYPKAPEIRTANRYVAPQGVPNANVTPVRSQAQTATGKPVCRILPQSTAAGAPLPVVKIIIPASNSLADIRGPSGNADGYSPFAAKMSAEQSVAPSTDDVKTSASHIAPQSELTNLKQEVTSSDGDDDDNPSHLLTAIRSHPLFRNRRVAPLATKHEDSSTARQVASATKDRRPVPLPKRKHGPPGRSASTDEPETGRTVPGGSTWQVRRSSETPGAVPPQDFIKNLRQVKVENQTTGNNTTHPAKNWNKNEPNVDEKTTNKKSTDDVRSERSSSAHSSKKPTNQNRDIGNERLSRVACKNPEKEGAWNATPLARVFELMGVTKDQSYTDDREEEEKGVETTGYGRGQSSSVDFRLAFDDVTGKQILADVTVDESETDPIFSLPPPPLEFTSGTSPDPVVGSSTGLTDPRNPTVHLTSDVTKVRSKFADVTSFPPPIHFDDIPDAEKVPFFQLRKTDTDVKGSEGVTGSRFRSLRDPPVETLPPPPCEFQVKNSTGKGSTSTSFDALRFKAENLKPVFDLTNQINNPLFVDTNTEASSSSSSSSSSASTPVSGREVSASNQKHVSRWSCEDVGVWLRSLGLGRYAPIFMSASVDGRRLCDLTRNDLINLGVKELGHRRDVERAVLRIKSQQIT